MKSNISQKVAAKKQNQAPNSNRKFFGVSFSVSIGRYRYDKNKQPKKATNLKKIAK
jgi:hypothetical protein